MITVRDCCWFLAACFAVCAAGVWVRWVTTDETSIETIRTEGSVIGAHKGAAIGATG